MIVRVGFHSRSLVLLTAALLVILQGCSAKVNQKALHDPHELSDLESLDGLSPWLKIHLSDGGLYVLSDWKVDDQKGVIIGVGDRLNARRDILAVGPHQVTLDSVALLESNVLHTSPAVAGLTVLTIVSLGMTAYCIANPKACFGSCPTFYAKTDAGNTLLVAEGFSASVAPALEDNDLDFLFGVTGSGNKFTVTMTNEALETHVVRRADLLAVPRPEGGRVLVNQRFEWQRVAGFIPVRQCLGPAGDVTSMVRDFDGIERTSLADSSYLGSKEYLVCEFDSTSSGPLGLVVSSRHALLSTYLFYQGLAYLGREAVPALARLGSRTGDAEGTKAIGDLLGRIEVQVPGPDDTWRPVGEVGETGPLAVNTHLLELPDLDPDDLRVRLVFTKGNWRVDQVALAVLEEPCQPLRLAPSAVLREGVPDPEALDALTDDSRSLVSLPGDRFDLVYDLPDAEGEWDLALESRGYYLEWMRVAWMAEEDPAAAAMMFKFPEMALRYLAPKYKALEPDMEAHFWGSRYAGRP